MSFVVVGVDGSEVADKALLAAVTQAVRLGADVRAMHVISLPALGGYDFAPLDVDAMRSSGEELLADAIGRLDAHFDGSTPVAISSKVVFGHSGVEIARAASADGGARMTVAGSRGFGGVKSVLLGSVTTYLAHHLTCPLLIIPDGDGKKSS